MADHIDMTKGVYRRIYSGCLRGDRINAVSRDAELCFWRLHCVADDFGNLIANPAELKVYAYPKRDVTEKQIVGWLEELRKAKLITLYRVGSDQCANIVDFTEYQPAGKNGKRIMRTPVNPGESGGILVNPEFSSASDTETTTESESDTETTPTRAADAAGFVRFWQAWPSTDRKMGKAKALASWKRQGCEAIADRIVAHVTACAESESWQNGYDPLPTTYLNRQQWEAPPPPKERKAEVAPKSGIAAALAKWEAEQ